MFILIYLKVAQKVSGFEIIRPCSGEGKTVQIDEVLLYRRKYNRGRKKRQLWIFGLVEQELPAYTKLLLVPVHDRTTVTLLPIISNHVAPGIGIVSDVFSQYKHLTVNHSLQFFNPKTELADKKIEALLC